MEGREIRVGEVGDGVCVYTCMHVCMLISKIDARRESQVYRTDSTRGFGGGFGVEMGIGEWIWVR